MDCFDSVGNWGYCQGFKFLDCVKLWINVAITVVRELKNLYVWSQPKTMIYCCGLIE